MLRSPKFILSDKVCLKRGSEGVVMYIQKFKTVLELHTNKRMYTGLIYCYWFESEHIKKGLYHEDELERAKLWV